MSSKGLRRRSFSLTTLKRKQEQFNNDLFIILQNPDQTLRFIQAESAYFRSFFLAFGLTFRPEAKDIEGIVEHDEVLKAWADFIQAAYQNPTFLIHLAKQIKDPFYRDLSKKYISFLFEMGVIRRVQSGGAFSIRNILFIIISLAVLLLSSLSGYRVYKEGGKPVNPVGLAIESVARAIGDLAKGTPGLEVVAKFAGKLSGVLKDVNEENTSIPRGALSDLVVGDTSNVEQYRKRVRSLERKRRTLAVERAKGGLGMEEPSNSFPSVEAWRKRNQEKEAEINKELEAAEQELSRLVKYYEELTNASKKTGPAYLAAQAGLLRQPSLYKLGENGLSRAISTQRGKVANIQGRKGGVTEALEKFGRLPASMPYLSNIKDVGPALQEAVGSDIDEFSYHIKGLISTDHEDPSVKRVLDMSKEIVEKASKVKSVNARVLAWLSGMLKKAVFDKLIQNVEAEIRIHRSAIRTIQASLGQIGEEELMDALETAAKSRGYTLTEKHITFVDKMMADMGQYGLSIEDAERMANFLITLFKGGIDGIDFAYVTDVQAHVTRLTADESDRVEAGLTQFFMCCLLSGMSVGAVMWMMGMKADGATPEQVIRVIREEAVREATLQGTPMLTGAPPGGYPMLPGVPPGGYPMLTGVPPGGYPMLPGYAQGYYPVGPMLPSVLPNQERARSRGRRRSVSRRGPLAIEGPAGLLGNSRSPSGGGKTRKVSKTRRNRRTSRRA